uniref:Uncharacterized protein n=1 Tax=Romanomermis culicivorax TaxID=13658 RepID=A0A915K710_ROMCU
MSSATSAIQALIPLLSDDNPNKEVNLNHTIWLCRYLDSSIFTASRIESLDFSSNESRDYYKASIQFCSQLISRYPELLNLPESSRFAFAFLEPHLYFTSTVTATVTNRISVHAASTLFYSDLTSLNEKFIEDTPLCFAFSESKPASIVPSDHESSYLKVELLPPVLYLNLFECERMQTRLRIDYIDDEYKGTKDS